MEQRHARYVTVFFAHIQTPVVFVDGELLNRIGEDKEFLMGRRKWALCGN